MLVHKLISIKVIIICAAAMQILKPFRTLVLSRHNLTSNRIYLVQRTFSESTTGSDLQQAKSSEQSEVQKEDQDQAGEI